MPDFDTTERELHSLLGEPKTAQHPSLQLLLASGQDVLPPEIESRVKAHLGSCRLCAQLLNDFATLPEVSLSPMQAQRLAATLLNNAPATVALRNRNYLPMLSAIAALLLLAVGGMLFLRKQAVLPVQTAATRPQPIAPVAIAELEIPLTPLSPPADSTLNLQTRGAGSQNPSIEQLLPAFNAYNKGDYPTAERYFVPLLKAYPKSEIVPLYVGVSRLFLHEDQQAYNALTLAQGNADPAALTTALWYSAIAAQRLRRPEARTLLTAICNAPPSRYTAESCRIAPTIP